MNKEEEKLNTFSYALSKLVETHKKNTCSDIQKALETFTNTRIMKLLYLLCLESMTIDENTGKVERGLFELFGSFYAFPNGPVLRDVYYILDKVPGFEYKDGHFCELLKDAVIVPDSYRDIIDSSINKLFTNLGMDVFKDREKLVSLTKKLPLWERALWDATKKMSIKPTDLAKDYKKYYELCSKLANKDI